MAADEHLLRMMQAPIEATRFRVTESAQAAERREALATPSSLYSPPVEAGTTATTAKARALIFTCLSREDPAKAGFH